MKILNKLNRIFKHFFRRFMELLSKFNQEIRSQKWQEAKLKITCQTPVGNN
jgi:hypothetical protein